jgi:hypothetical protein
MFGKPVSEYLRFQKVILALIAVVWALRFGLSLAGIPMSTVKWVSVTGVLILGTLYYGVAVHTRGFGSYKQLYALNLFQSVLGEWLVALAVVLGILTWHNNAFTVPEYSGAAEGRTWLHVLAHLVIGAVVLPLVGWAVSSLVLLVTRLVAPRKAG